MAIHHILTTTDLTRQEIEALFELTALLKKQKVKVQQPLAGKTLGLIFQKPSVRTRLSFEIGMHQLGGRCVYLGPEDIQLGQRESTKDLARVLSRYIDGIAVRTFAHQDVGELAQWSTVPVINGLSDIHHPCQALSDLFTILEHFGGLKQKIAWIGDGNNVCHSLMHACALLGAHLVVATPKSYEPDETIQEEVTVLAKKSGAKITLTNNPKEAAAGASVLYTDVWVSMGQEKERSKRIKTFKPYQLNKQLAALAEKRHVVMHCLPAHRGEEVTDEVLDSTHSIIYDQAENRLHLQKAILLWLLRGARRKS